MGKKDVPYLSPSPADLSQHLHHVLDQNPVHGKGWMGSVRRVARTLCASPSGQDCKRERTTRYDFRSPTPWVRPLSRGGLGVAMAG